MKVPADMEFEQIDVSDVDVKMLNKVTTDDILAFIIWLSRTRKQTNSSRARHIASLKSFFKYLHSKKRLIDSNPAYDIETPKIGKRNPKYLTLEQSQKLLETAYASPKESNARDYCMLTLFLNCGMRLSELTGINLEDIDRFLRSLRVIGKGNKERIIYLNDACKSALSEYLPLRESEDYIHSTTKALFVSSRGERMSNRAVQWTVEKYLRQAGLEYRHLSVHKLRHTAATLMYSEGGVDVRVLKEILGHEQLNTTQIYTHVSSSDIEKAMNRNPLSDEPGVYEENPQNDIPEQNLIDTSTKSGANSK
jgi:site-specific recombinase XerD